jgi:hypothetical protein
MMMGKSNFSGLLIMTTIALGPSACVGDDGDGGMSGKTDDLGGSGGPGGSGSGGPGSCVGIAESMPAVCSMSGAPRNVVFTNNCPQEIDIWWVTFGCTEKFYIRLAAGETFLQPSFVTHPWRARALPAPGGSGTKGALLKDFSAIPEGAGDYSVAVP